MSRPQYDRYSSQQYTESPYNNGPVVNGGLIDFQDNQHRGVNEYIVAAQQQQKLQMAAYQPQQLAAATFAYPPNVAQPAVLQATTQAPAACFSGPPSFVHINGVTYKPVEPEPVAQQPAVKSPPPAVAEAKPMTEDELFHAIDERVSSRVADYVSRKYHHHPRSVPTRDDEPEPRHHTVPVRAPDPEPVRRAAPQAAPEAVRRSARSKPPPDEDIEAAVQRVLQANASMFQTPSSSARAGLAW
jgi:hypothetical protein